MNSAKNVAVEMTKQQLITTFVTLANARHKAWLRLETLATKAHGLDVCITDKHLEANEYPAAKQQLTRTERALTKARVHYQNLHDAAEHIGAILRQVSTH